MGSDASAMFSREELLGGLSARRATTALFAIENRTAHLMVTAPQAVPIVLSERAATARERAFLEAVAQGRDPVPSNARIYQVLTYRFGPALRQLLIVSITSHIVGMPADLNPYGGVFVEKVYHFVQLFERL